MVYNDACTVLEINIEQFGRLVHFGRFGCFGGSGHFGCLDSLGSLGHLGHLDWLACLGCLGKNIKYLSFIAEPMRLKDFSVLFDIPFFPFRVDVDYGWPF